MEYSLHGLQEGGDGHVDFMLFMSISFALGSQRELISGGIWAFDKGGGLGVTSKFRWLQLRLFAAVCKRWQYYSVNLGQFKQSNIDIYCFNMIVYAYLNE